MNSHDIRRNPHVATPPSRMRPGLHALAATLITLLSVCAFTLRTAAYAPDFIYGLFCDEGDWHENRWFAIRRRDGKVYVSGRSEEIERVFRACGSKASFGLNRPGGIYRTFQSMREELSNE